MDEDIVSLLSVAYNGSKGERSAATARLEAALQSPNAMKYLLVLLQAGTAPNAPQELSMLALICAKNYVVRDLDERVAETFPEELEQTKAVLFDAALSMPGAQRKIIHQCISTMVSSFSWNFMNLLVPKVLETCGNVGPFQAPGGSDAVCAQLELLYVATKRFKTQGLIPSNVKLDVCRALAQPLSNLLALNDMHVYHILFKVVECIIESLMQLPKDTSAYSIVPQEVILSWLQLFSQFPQQHYEAASAAAAASPRAYATYVTCVKRIAIISYSLLNDATRRKKPAEVPTLFLSQCASAFLQMWKQWLSFCVASKNREVHKKSEMFAIRFIKLSCLNKTLYTSYVHPDALSIIENLLFPYLCYGDDDEEVFCDEENLSEFVQYMMDESVGQGELNQRQAASNAILTLLDGKQSYRDTSLLPGILQIIQQGLASPDTQESYTRAFGFLHLLSILRKQLRAMPEVWNTQMSTVLMTYVVPRALATCPHVALRTKAIVVLQRYSKVPFPNEQTFQQFIEGMCSFVEDSDTRIQLSGIDAMCTLLEMRRARKFLRPILVPLVKESLLLMEKVQTTYIPTVIVFLTEYFAPELTSVLDQLAAGIVQQFLAAAFDLEAGEAQDGDMMDDSNLQKFERTALSAVALLDALYTVVTASYRNPQAFVAMRPNVLRLVRRVLETPENYDFVEKTLSILLHVVNFSKPVPQECWDVLPLVFGIVDSGVGVDFFALIEEVLDNFMSNATVDFLTNEKLMEATYQACHKMLLGNVVTSEESQAGAPQLVEAMLHQAKHCTARSGLFDPYLRQFVLMLLQALVHPDVVNASVSLRIWILMALMDAFYYDANATLHILVDSNAYPKFFDGFFYLMRGVFAELNIAMSNSGADAAVGGGKKKKKGAKARSNDEAAEVLREMSILTRKVFTLGLTSLLTALMNPSHALHSSFHPTYSAQAVALISYCINCNEERYKVRCKVAEQNIQKIRSGAGEEDDAVDVDMTEDEILGLDGGDDLQSIGSNDSLGDVESNIDEDADGEEMDAADAGDDYESPIDDVCEVTCFLQWARAFLSPAVASQLGPAAALVSEGSLIEAEQVATRYRQLCIELEKADEEHHNTRMAS